MSLELGQDKDFWLVVEDLANDPVAAGPSARSTTPNPNLVQVLALRFAV